MNAEEEQSTCPHGYPIHLKSECPDCKKESRDQLSTADREYLRQKFDEILNGDVSTATVETVMSRISMIRSGREQTGTKPRTESTTVSATEGTTRESIEAGPQTDAVLEKQVKDWEAEYGIRLGYVDTGIQAETIAQNADKIGQVFARVRAEKGDDRIRDAFFSLADSGGSGYREGRRYLDITDDAESLYKTIIRNTGRGF